MHWSLKSAARIVLGAIPLRFYRAIIARDVLVFLYHVVGPPDLAHLRNLGRRLGRPLADRETFRRWILDLGPTEVPLIDEVCAILRIDVSGYLSERRPYLATEQIRRLVADGFTLGAHANRHVPLGSL